MFFTQSDWSPSALVGGFFAYLWASTGPLLPQMREATVLSQDVIGHPRRPERRLARE